MTNLKEDNKNQGQNNVREHVNGKGRYNNCGGGGLHIREKNMVSQSNPSRIHYYLVELKSIGRMNAEQLSILLGFIKIP